MNENILTNFYKNKKVFVTGHTGFKGSWLSIWLNKLGADVTGYSLAPNTIPNNFSLSNLEEKINSIIGDVRDYSFLKEAINKNQPEIVFHLAAQPLVRESFKDPLSTYQTNIIGLANLLEIIKESNTVKAVLVITSDKCYSNKEWIYGYKETDELGGYDPYSASKACAEIISSSYRNSFYTDLNIHIATARAGNVIGGGDWSKDRIIPDCIKGITSGKSILIRNPNSIRPWQHVLDPLSGYLELMYRLYNEGSKFADSWNFGPGNYEVFSVLDIVRNLTDQWKGNFELLKDQDNIHEAGILQLDCSKAYHNLGWKSLLTVREAVKYTIDWYKKYYEEKIDAYTLCSLQIENYSRIGEENTIGEYEY